MVLSAAHSLCGAGSLRGSGGRAGHLGYLNSHPFSGQKHSLCDFLRSRSSGADPDPCENIEVAIDATKEIKEFALEWALRNVAQSGESITLLAVIPHSHFLSCGWGLFGDCGLTGSCRFQDLEEKITDSCHQMMQQMQALQKDKEVQINLQVVEGGVGGITALRAERMHATWVILDRHLKQEGKFCLEKLECNVVLVNRSEAKILRLNLKRPPKFESKSAEFCSFESGSSLILNNISHLPNLSSSFERPEFGTRNATHSIHNISPEMGVSLTSSELGTPMDFSSESWPSPNSSDPNKWLPPTTFHMTSGSIYASSSLEYGSVESISDLENDQASLVTQSEYSSSESFPRIKLSTPGNKFSTSGRKLPASPKHFSAGYQNKCSTMPAKSRSLFKIDNVRKGPISEPSTSTDWSSPSPQKAQNLFDQLEHKFQNFTASELDPDTQEKAENKCPSNLRGFSALSRQAPPGPPPLCSICQHKSPQFGRPPQVFTYADLEAATSGFSAENFLAKGGFGSVHRGILTNGQVIAVKQLNLASSQGDNEFCVEVEVLSCAQQRNVVTLIGYCVEDHKRLLVYEFICNGSLDSHLFGQKSPALEWRARQKIAVGTARGLRYLHEECRVGCIIHRDLRPNNILLTHDFEPMVGDFGLARWQPDGALEIETRVIGTFGYLAPEYAQSGQITEKADVYSFGIVLLELVTGRKVIDLSRPKGRQCLTEWARPLLDVHLYRELADPRLHDHYNSLELYCMLQVVRLCICPNPDLRPRMSQVMRMLEGNVTVEARHLSSPWKSRHSEPFSVGSVLSEQATKSENLSSHSNRWEASTLPSQIKAHSEPFPCYRMPLQSVQRPPKFLFHSKSWSLIPH